MEVTAFVGYMQGSNCMYIDQCRILVSRLTLVDAYSICGSKCNFSCAVSTFRLEDIDNSLCSCNV